MRAGAIVLLLQTISILETRIPPVNSFLVAPSPTVRHRPHTGVSAKRKDERPSNYKSNIIVDDDDDEEGDNVLADFVSNLVGLLTRPSSVAWIYPVSWLLIVTQLSLPTAVLFSSLFVSLAWFGRWVGADDDALAMDALSLLVAVLAATTILPSTTDESSSPLPVVISCVGVGLAVLQIAKTPPPVDTEQELMMDDWDDRLRREQRKRSKSAPETRDRQQGRMNE